MVQAFASVSGSDGPTHLDEEYAIEHFGGLLVHGALLAEHLLASTLSTGHIGHDLSGIEVAITFRSPVIVNQVVDTQLEQTGDALTLTAFVDNRTALIETIRPVTLGGRA